MEQKIKRSKNIYVILVGMIILAGLMGSVFALGSSYTNGYTNSNTNEIKNSDDNIALQELNPNDRDFDSIEESNVANVANSLSYNSNSFYTETYRIYSAFSFIQGTKEIPRVHSNAFAIGEFLIDTQSNRLTYNILVFNMGNETKAEILGPATSRMNSNNTLLTLPTTSGYKTGIWNYPQSIESDLLKGKTYVNIYTQENPEGEIRGQIITTKAYVVRRYVNMSYSKTYYVDIRNSSFIPNNLTIKKGDTVIWKNYDFGYNNVRSDSGYELNSNRIPRGYFYSHKFNYVGNYSYHSTYNASMNGTIFVEN